MPVLTRLDFWGRIITWGLLVLLIACGHTDPVKQEEVATEPTNTLSQVDSTSFLYPFTGAIHVKEIPYSRRQSRYYYIQSGTWPYLQVIIANE